MSANEYHSQYGYVPPVEEHSHYGYVPPVEEHSQYGYAPPVEEQSQYGYVPPVEEHYKVPGATVHTQPVYAQARSSLVKPKRCYRPWVVTTPALAVLLVLALGLIGLIEYACRTLPTEAFKPKTLVLRSVVEVRHVAAIQGRDDSAPVVTATPNADLKPRDGKARLDERSPVTSSKPAEDYLQRNPSEVTRSYRSQSEYLSREVENPAAREPTPASDTRPTAPVSSRPSGDYLGREVETDGPKTSARPSSDYLEREVATPTPGPVEADPGETTPDPSTSIAFDKDADAYLAREVETAGPVTSAAAPSLYLSREVEPEPSTDSGPSEPAPAPNPSDNVAASRPPEDYMDREVQTVKPDPTPQPEPQPEPQPPTESPAPGENGSENSAPVPPGGSGNGNGAVTIASADPNRYLGKTVETIGLANNAKPTGGPPGSGGQPAINAQSGNGQPGNPAETNEDGFAPSSRYLGQDVTAGAPGAVPTGAAGEVAGPGGARTGTGTGEFTSGTAMARPVDDYLARGTGIDREIGGAGQSRGGSRSGASATSGTGSFTATAVEGQAVVTEGPNRIDRELVYLSDQRYFVGAYLPTLLAIVFRILIGMVYGATKMMEPFYCLAEPAGALAKDFLNINYLSTNDSWDPFMAMLSGHWLMLAVSVLFSIVGLLTPFATEFLSFTRFCNSNNVCGPEMRVNPTIGRVLEAILALTVVMIVVFWAMQRRHKSGIYADPSSIATMASLFHNPDVVESFRRIDPESSKVEIEKALANKRFRLDSYMHADGSERYGLVTVQDGHAANYGSAYAPVNTYEGPPPTGPNSGRQFHYRFRLVRDIIFGMVTCGALIVITYYYTVGKDSGFERFMSGEGFGPRFLMSIIGITIQGQWKRIERETCIIQAFRQMNHGRASAHSSILVERTLNPITTLTMSLTRGHLFVALIAVVAVLAEVLIVTLAGVPFSAGQIHIAFQICSFVSMAILASMLVALVLVWVRARTDPNLPRTPNTIGAVFSYLCGAATTTAAAAAAATSSTARPTGAGASMLDDFADMATLGRRRRNKRVAALKRRYALRVVQGYDAIMRWTVDYDHDDANDLSYKS